MKHWLSSKDHLRLNVDNCDMSSFKKEGAGTNVASAEGDLEAGNAEGNIETDERSRLLSNKKTNVNNNGTSKFKKEGSGGNIKT